MSEPFFVDVAKIDADYPRVSCPKCGQWETDMDGFGFLSCNVCGHCTHPARTDGECGLCGELPELSEAEKRAADSLPADFVQHLFAGDRATFHSDGTFKAWVKAEPPTCPLCNGSGFPGTTERNCPQCYPEAEGI